MLIHVNGRLVPEAEATVPVFDRGFLFGDGIFESMRVVGGRIFRLDRHLERLRRSAGLIGLALPGGPGAIGEAALHLLRENRLAEARVRITVTRGPGRPGDHVEAPGPPTVVMIAAPYAGPDPVLRERGVTVAIPLRRQIPAEAIDPSIKSISRLASVLARREARDQGAFEAVLLDHAGNLTEGTASNLFLVVRGRLLTAVVPEGGLPGVTRQAVLELAHAAGIEVHEDRLPVHTLSQADEAFLTNTSWEVLPVVRVDQRPVGDGRPGAMTRDLQGRYRDLLRRECGGD